MVISTRPPFTNIITMASNYEYPGQTDAFCTVSNVSGAGFNPKALGSLSSCQSPGGGTFKIDGTCGSRNVTISCSLNSSFDAECTATPGFTITNSWELDSPYNVFGYTVTGSCSST